jgi:DNA-binding response OmpR family regulator
MSYILIAEDDPHIQLLIQRKLETAGYEVRGTPDGSEAVRVALSEKPDVVILDVMLPGLSGLDVCRKIKEHFNPKAPPVIIISARGQAADVAAGEAAGADNYLIKPFSPGELLKVIEDTLRR